MNKPKILLPVHPQWCEKIFNGEKTIEVRKTAPKIDTPFEVLVYQTKHKGGKAIVNEVLNSVYGGGKVIGSFVCDRIDEIEPDLEYYSDGYDIDDDRLAETCLSREQLSEYGKGATLRGLHITEPKLFDKPKELGEFGTICKKDGNDECGDCPYLQVHVNSYPCDDCIDTWCGVGNIKPLTRAPQSWIYVETV